MKVTTRVRIENDAFFISKGVAELLEAIDSQGSIKKASEMMHISYTKANKMLRKINDGLGFALVISQKGGNNRGETLLTEKGKEVLACYRAIEQEIEDFAKVLVHEKFVF